MTTSHSVTYGQAKALCPPSGPSRSLSYCFVRLRWSACPYRLCFIFSEVLPRLSLSFVLPWSLSLHSPLSGRRLLSLRFPASSFGGGPDPGLLSFCCFTLESDPASPTSAPSRSVLSFALSFDIFRKRSASHVIQNHSLGRETCCRLSPFHRWLWSVVLRSRSRTGSFSQAQARWPT